MKSLSVPAVFLFSLGLASPALGAAPEAGAEAAPVAETELVVAMGAPDLAAFERNAKLAKELGATHVVITDNLPPALWQFDPPDDPYPAWFVYRPSLLKIFPPKEVQPYVNMEYAEKIAQVLEARCRILRQLGLKAYWGANEPQVMPEAFFTAFPELRGPRVDQANRSRTARFAPCVDQPETRRLYREAMQNLLRRCPEVEIFNFLTTDSGSGFCWSPGLYPGQNGPSDCKDRPMEERVASFLRDLQQAGRDAGHAIEVCINEIQPRQWMQKSFESPAAIVKSLPRGLAVDNMEGPDGRTFLGRSSLGSTGRGAFYPVLGIAVPPMGGYAARLGGRGAGARRQMVDFGDEASLDFNVSLYRATRDSHPKNELERLANLRAFAVTQVGEAQADVLMSLWASVNEVQRGLNALDFGPVFRMGLVLTRWINRPLVPFPGELTAEQKSYYRPYLFQAKGEAQADDLVDIQAMRMYEGWGAHLLFQRVIEVATPSIRSAVADAGRLSAAAPDGAGRQRWDLLRRRLEAVDCLMHTADNVVAYQAQLDRVRQLGRKPEPNPVLGVQSGWDRTDLMATARREIDNTVHLLRLLESTREPLLDLAPTPGEETIMRLGLDLPAQLKRKIDLMNSKWEDYQRLFTTPNP
jgi:hypothetical protein